MHLIQGIYKMALNYSVSGEKGHQILHPVHHHRKIWALIMAII